MKNNFVESGQSPDPGILFMVFNRPDPTIQVFNMIRLARPRKLYIASDGPRKNKVGEEEKVLMIRDYIIKNIDWDVEVHTLFNESNLGCGKSVETAISWFFENELMGIILEDDCLPSLSFFSFCKENLVKYMNDTRISAICGNNFSNETYTSSSYFFSQYSFNWGWASWRRSWESHKNILSNFEEIVHSVTTLRIQHKPANRLILQNAIKAHSGEIDTWDNQWFLSNYLVNGLTITPKVNLVRNIGFNSEATHTHGKYFMNLSLKQSEMNFPLNHPTIIIPNLDYDIFLYKNVIQMKTFWQKILDVKNHPLRLSITFRSLILKFFRKKP